MSPLIRNKRVLLPLLHILKSMRSDHRVILMSHLDDEARDAIYQTIFKTLTSSKVPLRKRLFLKSKLLPYKSHLRYLASSSKPSRAKKRRLAQMGGGAMSDVLRVAIPLLINLK